MTSRDQTCQFATCHRPAVECDLDHQIPWPHGPTTARNLQTLCRRHHQMKTHLGSLWDSSSDAEVRAG
ncbi:HNH endonuclease signature motif containing protein [Aeromicrobium sp. UC242_57]|uniref:HNH endonuclease signature motif containing protein n=1 Tax=Aeromicrobium sp. UC242_57 TaxID=3374624 RepID=UPI00379B637F